VDWRALQGAYGASDGSVVDGKHVLGDVPGALTTLATEADSDSSAWMDALDVLESHVSH